jgi:hypothetical protein
LTSSTATLEASYDYGAFGEPLPGAPYAAGTGSGTAASTAAGTTSTAYPSP